VNSKEDQKSLKTKKILPRTFLERDIKDLTQILFLGKKKNKLLKFFENEKVFSVNSKSFQNFV